MPPGNSVPVAGLAVTLRTAVVLFSRRPVRGDHSAGDHVDVTETLDRAVIWPPGDAFPDVVVYSPVAEAARVNVVVGDSEYYR